MGEVLRQSLLTRSSTDLANSTWDSEKWSKTEQFLLSSFGVGRNIIGEQIRFLEVFKQVESQQEQGVYSKDRNVFETMFAKDWAEIVDATCERFQIVLQTSLSAQALAQQKNQMTPNKTKSNKTPPAKRQFQEILTEPKSDE